MEVEMANLREGSSGPEVTKLQQLLKDKRFDPGMIDGQFGPGTEAAVMAFQRSEGLVADGIAGPNTLAKLRNKPAPPDAPLQDITDAVTVSQVSKMCAFAPVGNIKKYLPDVLASLSRSGLGDKAMVLMAIATIRAETGGFEPISEFKSRFNTSPNGHPFDLYDNRKDLGNRGEPDGSRFKGRGFVQLTGRDNYHTFSQRLGLGNGLVDNPELANDAKIAADLLALFLKNKEADIRSALGDGDLATARKLVNGGHHGLTEFSEAYRIGDALL
jgi:peptidoglycan hydrolase-like protein with peptidoglycan-binding domain